MEYKKHTNFWLIFWCFFSWSSSLEWSYDGSQWGQSTFLVFHFLLRSSEPLESCAVEAAKFTEIYGGCNLISLCSRMSRQLWVVKLLPRPPLPSRPPRKRGGSTKTERPQLPQLLLPRLIPQTRYQSAHQTHPCFCLEANLISLHSLLSSLSQVAVRQNVTHLLESFFDFPPIHWWQKRFLLLLCWLQKNPENDTKSCIPYCYRSLLTMVRSESL